MEKCTFCVQKIRRAQVEIEQRDGESIDDQQLRTRNLNPACVQACPSDVLVFGDFNDPNSRVAELSHDERQYKLFEHLGTDPNVIYLKKIDLEAEDEDHH